MEWTVIARRQGTNFVLFLCVFLLVGCWPAPNYPWVDLDEPPLPATLTFEIQPPLRIAISAILSPSSTAQNYERFLTYLAEHLGRPVELVQRSTYAEVNNLLCDGGVDLALVCTGAYVRGHQDFGMQLLVIPQVKGETVYYSYIIVPADSPAHTLLDLRDKVFAFTDPMSNSGHLMPVYMLRQAGEAAESFFSRTTYTYSHDNSIRAVAEGLVDGAAVDSLVYQFATSRDPSLAERVRVIAKSQACGMPPVVVHPNLDKDLKASLRELLLTMHQNPPGRAALADLMIDRFVLTDDSAYDSIHAAMQQLGELP